MKKTINLKKISDIFYFTAFILSFAVFFCLNKTSTNIFGIDFCYNKINGILILILNFSLFMFNFLSKNSLKNTKKLFYLCSIPLLIFGNLILLTDNIFVIFVLLLLIHLIDYLFNNTKYSFLNDFLTLFISFGLLSFGLMKYFTLYEISLTFQNIAQFQYKIDDFVNNLAFWGLLILIFRLFNFLPFNTKNENTYIFSYNRILYFIIGCYLSIKVFPLFNYFFDKSQNIIMCYLLFNLIYFSFLQIKSKNMIEFLKLTMPANAIIGFFSLFSYSEVGVVSFIYYSIGLILTYLGCFILSDIIKKAIGTDNFDSLKKISYGNKLIILFTFVVFLNLAKIPPFVGFFSGVYSTLNLFLIDTSGFIMTCAPYVTVFSSLLISINSLNVLTRVTTEPIEEIKSFPFDLKQKSSLLVICFCIFITGAGINFIINYLLNIINAGSI
jgi:formate hydrogenlyase subunit 3/multisubunit Na+/H+ antiporter MnhD subunit